MKIYIMSMTREVLSIDIEPFDIIETIKEKIQVEWGFFIEDQTLVFHGFFLDNYYTLADYNIHKENTINLIIEKKNFSININIFGIQKLTIDTRNSEIIKSLKIKIYDKIGVPINKQNLIYLDMILEDNNLIKDYNIKENSTIDCIITDYKINQIIIYVDIKKEKSIKIECNPLDTILSIKYKIRKELGYSIDIQNLIYCKDIILDNFKTLQDYKIDDNSIIFLELKQTQNLEQKKTQETKNEINILKDNINTEENDKKDCSKSLILRLRGPPQKLYISENKPIIKDDSKIINQILFQKINELESSLQTKNNENDKLKEKIKELNEEMNKVKLELKNKDDLISIKFISEDQKINYILKCAKTDTFLALENSLYELYPEYKNSENDFLINGQVIDKNKSIEENRIKENDSITVKPKI